MYNLLHETYTTNIRTSKTLLPTTHGYQKRLNKSPTNHGTEIPFNSKFSQNGGTQLFQLLENSILRDLIVNS